MNLRNKIFDIMTRLNTKRAKADYDRLIKMMQDNPVQIEVILNMNGLNRKTRSAIKNLSKELHSIMAETAGTDSQITGLSEKDIKRFITSVVKEYIKQNRSPAPALQSAIPENGSSPNMNAACPPASGGTAGDIPAVSNSGGGSGQEDSSPDTPRTGLLEKGINWLSSPARLSSAVQALKDMSENTRKLDKALEEINYTLNVSDRQLKEIGQASLQAARDLNTSAANVLDAVSIYADSSRTAQDILNMAEPAIMLGNVTGMDVQATSDILNGVMEQFGLSEKQLLHISDVLQTVSMSMPYDFADGIRQLGNGIQASGSAARNAGFDLEHYTSLLGALMAGTGQSGEQTGSVLRTMMNRISQASSSALTNGLVSREELAAAENALRQISIEVQNDSGYFKSFDAVMGELYRKLGSLSEADLGNLAVSVAGTNQTKEFEQMLQSYGNYERMVEETINAGGTTLRNQERHAESLDGKLKEISATWESIGARTMNSGLMKGLADIGILISNIIEKIGLARPAIAAFIAVWQKDRSIRRFCPAWV